MVARAEGEARSQSDGGGLWDKSSRKGAFQCRVTAPRRSVCLVVVLLSLCTGTVGFGLAPSNHLAWRRLECSRVRRSFMVELKASDNTRSEPYAEMEGAQPPNADGENKGPILLRRLRASVRFVGLMIRKTIHSKGEEIVDNMFYNPPELDPPSEDEYDIHAQANVEAEAAKRSQIAMIYGVQGQYTRRRLAEIDIGIHLNHHTQPAQASPAARTESHAAPSAQPASHAEAAAVAAATGAGDGEEEDGDGARILREIAESEANAAATAFLDAHLRGVPDVHRPAAAAAAAGAAPAGATGAAATVRGAAAAPTASGGAGVAADGGPAAEVTV